MSIDDDEPALILLADSWSGHSSARQQAELKQMGAEVIQIPLLTTDKLQSLDVNYNRQYKIFYNRIAEEAFFDDIISNVTSRDRIINVHSLIHDQLSSEKYQDMLLYAWRNTDPAFDRSELGNFPPRMVQDIQFNFDPTSICQARGCTKHAFIRCSHCGKLMCLKHFLNRECTHLSRPKRSTDADSCESDESCDEPRTANVTSSSDVTRAGSENSALGVLASVVMSPIAAAAISRIANLNSGSTSTVAPELDHEFSAKEPFINLAPGTTRKPARTRSKLGQRFKAFALGGRRDGRF